MMYKSKQEKKNYENDTSISDSINNILNDKKKMEIINYVVLAFIVMFLYKLAIM